RLLLREPHTKIIALLPLLSAALFFGILYGLSTVISELRIMDGVVTSSGLIEFLKPFPFRPDEILYSWPLFLCFALFVIASDLSSNLFGIERQGIQQLMLVPVSSWQIILSKNLSILGFVCIPILLFYSCAFFFTLHSLHTFHAIWMYFVLGLFFLFIAGNFISIFFPMRIDSSISGSLQRDSFARTLGMALSRFILFTVMGLVTLPILYECVRPLWGMPGYFSPYTLQADSIVTLLLSRLISIWPEHGLYTLYALGAYCAALFWLSSKFDQRREVLLREMGRMES
ncbi:hypothetical protein HOF92_09115, partial [bacterium]|nr:hypothetical protein [bacterium]